MSKDTKQAWIEDVEIENAQVKWAFSHFDGREDTYNAEGDHNFTIILDPQQAKELMAAGWDNIREMEPYEEGDDPEFLMKVKISYKYEAPRVYLIKGERKFRADQRDLADIKRSTCEQIDVIITPSRWVNGNRSGVSAYVKEMYAKIKQSRFSERYADYEEI